MKPYGLTLACFVDGDFLGRARGDCPDFFVLMPCMPCIQKAGTSSSAKILLVTSEQNDCLYRVPGKAFELGKFQAQATDACCNSALPHANLLLCPGIALSGCSLLRGDWPSLPWHCSLSAALTAVQGARGLRRHVHLPPCLESKLATGVVCISAWL